jgi:biotin carboxyl carrier protein
MNEFVVTINGRKYNVCIFENGQVELNGKMIAAELSKINSCSMLLKVDEKPFEIAVNRLEEQKYGMLLQGWYFESIIRSKLQERAYELNANKERAVKKADFKAPMPGLILKLKKLAGQQVAAGEPLLILEAMKMENELRSPYTGRIKEIFYKEGEPVEKDAVILTIE